MYQCPCGWLLGYGKLFLVLLKNDAFEFTMCTSDIFFIFSAQFDAMREELEVRREECLQLKSVLANTNRSILANDCYGGQTNIINEGMMATACIFI